MDFNKETGEINIISGQEAEMNIFLEMLKESNDKINYYKDMANYARTQLLKLAQFGEGKTARVQGEKYKCKIELPSKIGWDQKKLSHIYSVYPYGTIVDSVVKIASYKVDMREYKKIVNTVGGDDFNKFKDELISANLGIIGTPRFTIEQ